MMKPDEMKIRRLGKSTIDSPTCTLCDTRDDCNGVCRRGNCVDDSAKILFENRLTRLPAKSAKALAGLAACEQVGARRKIFFDPAKVCAGIVTCGGLCPGLNDVIRAAVMCLHFRYGVRRVLGFRYGYEGIVEKHGHTPMKLTPAVVDHIHETGGTILGSSRGAQKFGCIVDNLVRLGVNILLVIGGDGTQKGARNIAAEVARRGLAISIIGIPKTIDNDIMYLDKSFGFETASAAAGQAVRCAHTEAKGALNGIGLVKLMGRESGFIACNTALASGDANFVLIPEVPFKLDGPGGFLATLEHRLRRRKHACIIIAEGAGQDLMQAENLGQDASGNARLGDIGLFLKDKIKEYLTACGMEHTVKYIDPSYVIRSVPASASDSLYCLRLAQGAVHAAMTGRTDMVVGQVNNHIVHLPMELVTTGRKKVDPKGSLWRAVLETTGQPVVFGAGC
jgi:6-phosphofructokinase 1